MWGVCRINVIDVLFVLIFYSESLVIFECFLVFYFKKIDFSFGCVEWFFGWFGNLYVLLLLIIYVVGINGKGLVVVFLEFILIVYGYLVYIYMFFYFVCFYEWIKFVCEKGMLLKLIDESFFVDFFEVCECVNGGDVIMFFEIIIVLVFCVFV